VDLLAALRSATRAAHARLDARIDLPRVSTDATAYAALLCGFRSVHAPTERALARCARTAAVVPDWPERRRTGWLDADLAALGVRPPHDAAVPRIATAGEALGTLYVLEGSTLGGAVIVRGLDAAFPRRFLASYGARRGRMWRTFCGYLAGADVQDAERDAAVVAAAGTFAAFEAAFDRALSEVSVAPGLGTPR
jgi:heme oxygenase (biliverdin-IX-beta and delta-forming)